MSPPGDFCLEMEPRGGGVAILTGRKGLYPVEELYLAGLEHRFIKLSFAKLYVFLLGLSALT